VLHGAAALRDGAPARNVSVHLPDSPYRAVTDSLGQFEISDILPGPYGLAVLDPRVAPLRFEIPTAEKFVAPRDTMKRAFLVPTLSDYIIDRCVADRRYTPSDSVFIIGRTMTGDGFPVAGGSIIMRQQSENPEGIRLPESYRVGTNGMFQFCGHGLTKGTSVKVEAFRAGAIAGTTTVQLTDNVTVAKIVIAPR
jgi:hypothetical protein